jgi:hypothetical protein
MPAHIFILACLVASSWSALLLCVCWGVLHLIKSSSASNGHDQGDSIAEQGQSCLADEH